MLLARTGKLLLWAWGAYQMPMGWAFLTICRDPVHMGKLIEEAAFFQNATQLWTLEDSCTITMSKCQTRLAFVLTLHRKDCISFWMLVEVVCSSWGSWADLVPWSVCTHYSNATHIKANAVKGSRDPYCEAWVWVQRCNCVFLNIYIYNLNTT